MFWTSSADPTLISIPIPAEKNLEQKIQEVVGIVQRQVCEAMLGGSRGHRATGGLAYIIVDAAWVRFGVWVLLPLPLAVVLVTAITVADACTHRRCRVAAMGACATDPSPILWHLQLCIDDLQKSSNGSAP